MCGFFGIKCLGGVGSYFDSEFDVDRALAATDAIRHRGPDDEGFIVADTRAKEYISLSGKDTPAELGLQRIEALSYDRQDLFFGFRRLSIIDISSNGHQPMNDAEGRASLVFNGEVYNYRELRDFLVRVGIKFESESDTEVVLKSYLYWGTECFEKFVGMWAIAIWDYRRDRLVLSRDPFGIKPLYFSVQKEGLLFGSELKALRAYKPLNKASPQAVYNFMARGRSGLDDNSIYDGVFQVPAGSFVAIDKQTLAAGDVGKKLPPSSVFNYWKLDTVEKQNIDFSTASEILRGKFLESIRLHVRADVPIAVNLSGGVDSSAVLMAAGQLLGGASQIQTFSFIANEEFLSEEKWVDLVAARAGVTSNKFKPSVDDLVTDVLRFIDMQDEPVGSMSPYAQYKLFETVSKAGIKVTLDGQGADEYLAGYNGYLPIFLAELIQRGELIRANNFAKKAAKKTLGGYRKLLLSSIKQSIAWEKLGSGRAGIGQSPILQMEYFLDSDVKAPESFAPKQHSYLTENLGFTLTNSSLPELLRFADRNSMAHSIESRVPFLTTDLVSFCLSLPSEYLIDYKANTKAVFKKAMAGILPTEIIERKDKIGFTVPEKDWMLSHSKFIEDALDFSRLPVKLATIKKRWVAMRDGGSPYDPTIWRTVSLGLFCEQNNVSFN